jgi:hypothetical protein
MPRSALLSSKKKEEGIVPQRQRSAPRAWVRCRDNLEGADGGKLGISRWANGAAPD